MGLAAIGRAGGVGGERGGSRRAELERLEFRPSLRAGERGGNGVVGGKRVTEPLAVPAAAASLQRSRRAPEPLSPATRRVIPQWRRGQEERAGGRGGASAARPRGQRPPFRSAPTSAGEGPGPRPGAGLWAAQPLAAILGTPKQQGAYSSRSRARRAPHVHASLFCPPRVPFPPLPSLAHPPSSVS